MAIDLTPSTETAAPAPVSLTWEQRWAVVQPARGERVLRVPQAYSTLACPHDERCLIGQPADVLEQVASTQYGSPSWMTCGTDPYAPRRGDGLLVVRDGVVRRGPSNWDSGD